jgi:hypothetical protein
MGRRGVETAQNGILEGEKHTEWALRGDYRLCRNRSRGVIDSERFGDGVAPQGLWVRSYQAL